MPVKRSGDEGGSRMIIQARLISMGRGGKTAQVVVCFGEGPQRRSITRHLVLRNGEWWGRNPDEASLACLDMAEKTLIAAVEQHEKLLSFAQIQIDKLTQYLDRTQQHQEQAGDVPAGFSAFVGMLLIAATVNPEALKAKIEADVTEATHALAAAMKHAEELRKSVPREVRFSFEP